MIIYVKQKNIQNHEFYRSRYLIFRLFLNYLTLLQFYTFFCTFVCMINFLNYFIRMSVNFTSFSLSLRMINFFSYSIRRLLISMSRFPIFYIHAFYDYLYQDYSLIIQDQIQEIISIVTILVWPLRSFYLFYFILYSMSLIFFVFPTTFQWIFMRDFSFYDVFAVRDLDYYFIFCSWDFVFSIFSQQRSFLRQFNAFACSFLTFIKAILSASSILSQFQSDLTEFSFSTTELSSQTYQFSFFKLKISSLSVNILISCFFIYNFFIWVYLSTLSSSPIPYFFFCFYLEIIQSICQASQRTCFFSFWFCQIRRYRFGYGRDGGLDGDWRQGEFCGQLWRERSLTALERGFIGLIFFSFANCIFLSEFFIAIKLFIHLLQGAQTMQQIPIQAIPIFPLSIQPPLNSSIPKACQLIYNLFEVQMHKLFALSQLRTIQRLGVPQFTPDLYDQIIKNNNLVIRGDSLLYRLPREELKHAINIQCPINSLEQKYADAIIGAAKQLRRHGGVNQSRICGACQFLSTCKQAKKELESKQVDDGLKSMLVLFYGLQNLAKPEAVFFRQWTSIYRLGDSIIAAVNDLAQGGVEIDEYEKCRLEGIKLASEKAEKKKLQDGANGDQAKVEEMLKTVEKVRKSEKKPRAKPSQQARQTKQDREGVAKSGEQFSFEKEAQFEPKVKFSRDNPPRQDRPSFDPIHKQKGYQKIGDESYQKPYGQGQGQKYERKPYNPDYNRQKKPYKDYKERSFDGPRKQSYEGKDNFQKKNDWNKNRDYKPAYQKQAYVQDEGYPKIKPMNRSKPSYEQGERREESYDPKKRSSYGEQKEYKPREYQPRESRQPRQYQPRQARQYKPRQPREYQPRQPRQDRQYQPREQKSNRQHKNLKEGDRDPQAKSYNKENPHVSKWNIENQSGSRSASRTNQPKKFTPQTQKSEPKSQPRILEAEQITFGKSAGDEGARRGRTVRRSRGKTPTQQGEE